MKRILATLALLPALWACGNDTLVARPPSPPYEDWMEQAKASKIDILFVVDNSGSMLEEQQALSSNFGEFLKFIDPDTGKSGETNEVDYRLAVTTSDANNDKGELKGKVKVIYP